ncbi:hypothetical protein BX666DRAFT_2140230 [Dichotomocladium elegans]|nr:hypothetical protein BX666DRAFT_2140230 [Dichotomocladium elegans]
MLSSKTFRQLHRFRRPNLTGRTLTTGPTAKFTTNPYVASISRLSGQAKQGAKYAGIATFSLVLTTAIAWQSYHLYIEQFLESTPEELTYTARNLLHGAYVREHLAPDFEMAALYVREALRIALEDQKINEASDTMIRLRLRLAEDENRAGNILDSITEYTRAWKLLMARRDEFGPELIKTAKSIGDLYVRIGDFDHAEESLAWAFHELQGKDSDAFLAVTTTCSLASLYAAQQNFKLAVPLFASALKRIPDDQQTSEWVCLRAIIQNQLCESMYGMGKLDEALGWAQASLESCTVGEELDGKNNRNKDCQECGGVASNNMGKMLELKGNFEEALKYYQRAIAFANAASDITGQKQYSSNAELLKERIQIIKNDGITTASDITTVLEPPPSKDPPAAAWWKNLWK